jgi:hypothetical protein
VNLDGKPLANVMVTFNPDAANQPQSTGVTDDAGHFELRCNNGAPGAVVGQHRVVVVDAARFIPAKDRDADELPTGDDVPPSRVPSAYGRPDTTPLRQDVAKGSQTVTIEVKSNLRPP